VTLDHLEQGHLGLLARLLDLHEQRALGDGRPDPEPDQHERARQEERDAPAPRQERLLGQHEVQQGEHAGGEQVAHGHADLRPARVEPALVGRAVLE
jgi:hypothetical protein